jgi:hypothetical protein
MRTLNIKTHRQGKTYAKPHFFILNKGNNSGKPLLIPCANCFVIQCKNPEEKEKLFWLIRGLWTSKAFHQYLRGSVIPFITLNDLSKCIFEGYQQAQTNPEQFQKSVKTLRSLEEIEKQYYENLRIIADARRVIFHRYMKKG